MINDLLNDSPELTWAVLDAEGHELGTVKAKDSHGAARAAAAEYACQYLKVVLREGPASA